MGSVFFTAMLQTAAKGSFDAATIADALVPQLIEGLENS